MKKFLAYAFALLLIVSASPIVQNIIHLMSGNPWD